MGWFDDTRGMRDGIYEDEDTWLDASRDGYSLTDRRGTRKAWDSINKGGWGREAWGRDKIYGPLKEDEMIDLLDELHFPNRKQIKIAIHEHAEDYPKYRSEKIVKSKGRVVEQPTKEQPESRAKKRKSSNRGCGCLTLIIIIILVFAYIGANSDDSESDNGQNPGAPQAISHVLKVTCTLT
jgi:hypothetical protein